MMIDYFAIDFWLSMGQVISAILLMIFFFSWVMFQRYRRSFLILTLVFAGLNFATLVLVAIWPFVF